MEPEELITQTTAVIRSINIAIDNAQHLANSIARGDGGREIALTITKLQEGKMWTAQILSSFPEEYHGK